MFETPGKTNIMVGHVKTAQYIVEYFECFQISIHIANKTSERIWAGGWRSDDENNVVGKGAVFPWWGGVVGKTKIYYHRKAQCVG